MASLNSSSLLPNKTNTQLKSSNGQWAHLVAIGGTGMGALAALLQDLGYTVTGSDGVLYPPMSTFLESRKIPRLEKYSADNLVGGTWGMAKANPDLVIVGNAISRGHVEAAEVERLVAEKKTVRMSFAEGLAEFAIGNKESFVIAGTHGKTTTTSLMTWAIEGLGSEPGFFIGGIPANYGFGCRLGHGEIFVSEGDEYDTAYWDKVSKFLHYRATWVLCTGVEYDHADIYPDLQSIQRSFEKLIEKTKSGWVVVENESAPKPEVVSSLAATAKTAGLKVIRYGFRPESEARIISWQEIVIPGKRALGTKCVFRLPNFGELEMIFPMSGKHNILNLCGVMATLDLAGKLQKQSVDKLQKLFLEFKGIKRRQEELFADDHLIVVDDFAHHPTAIRETIAAIKKRYPKKRVFSFFEARSATSARNIFLEEFGSAFDESDEVFLVPPTKSNVPEAEKLNIQGVADRIAKHKIPVVVEKDIDQLCGHFFERLELDSSGVVALVMSNGAFGGLHQKIISRWKELQK
jgi:UDP-N-acetylmuramate: L-alanyl-gamma-D-glutamyl-meso-diaminopimelate ligase